MHVDTCESIVFSKMTAQILLDYSYLGPRGVLSATAIMLVLAVVAVVFRYATRYQTESRILADDILILAALVRKGAF